MTLDQLNELEDEFYGEEENEDDEGVFEDNYELAEWARSNVPDLFSALRKFLEAKE
jgi:hypothetical protein